MSPVVLEAPAMSMSMHNTPMSPIARLSQFSPNGTSDLVRSHESLPSPVSSPLPPSDRPQTAELLPLEPLAPSNLSSDQIDPSLMNSEKDKASRGPCLNCGIKDTPLWRRDADGNPLCNACGELFFSDSIIISTRDGDGFGVQLCRNLVYVANVSCV